MTSEQESKLREMLAFARQEASRVGPQHSLWDVISDAECLLAGKPTMIKGTPDGIYMEIMRHFASLTARHWDR